MRQIIVAALAIRLFSNPCFALPGEGAVAAAEVCTSGDSPHAELGEGLGSDDRGTTAAEGAGDGVQAMKVGAAGEGKPKSTWLNWFREEKIGGSTS